MEVGLQDGYEGDSDALLVFTASAVATPALRFCQQDAQNGRPPDESQNRTPPGKATGQSGRSNRLFASDNSSGLRSVALNCPVLLYGACYVLVVCHGSLHAEETAMPAAHVG
jgi:hypothetical protein